MSKLNELAIKHLGEDLSPTQGKLGCVETIWTLLDEAGIPVKERLSTIRFAKELSRHPLFKEIKNPEENCIIISITESDTNRGHVGLVGKDGKIYSNNSKNSKLDDHYGTFTWKWKYRKLQTKYYRYLKEKHREQLEKQYRTLAEKVVNLYQQYILLLQEKIMNYKHLGSSANPAKLSATIKGVGIWLIPALIFGAGYLGLNVVETDLVKLLDEVARVVGSIVFIFGLLRKIYMSNTKTE